MNFKKTDIGKNWYCPICGRKSLNLFDNKKAAHCFHCRKSFQLWLETVPDPNSKTGEKECGQKVKHETLESAFQHCSELPELPHRAQVNLCVYRCRICAQLHVGHKGKIERRNEMYGFLELKERYGKITTIQQRPDSDTQLRPM